MFARQWRRSLAHGGTEKSAVTAENSLVLLTKLNIKLPRDAETPLPNMCPRELETDTESCTCTGTSVRALVTMAKR